jgi:transcriptional regulator with XRE-family HTH domain
MLDERAFGQLIRAYRTQRGWTQAQLGKRWGHTGEYVSQIETGNRKLNSTSQLVRLADILDIPQEKLEAIGRGIPERKKTSSSRKADDQVLQMLLTPGRDMVRMSWIAWIGDQHPSIEGALLNLTVNLEAALMEYGGEFATPAWQLLAYAHQMQGKIAFDRLNYAAAAGHFSEMIDLGQQVNNADIIALGMTHQGDVFRKRGRYETALKCLAAAEPYAQAASSSIQGLRVLMLARTHYFRSDEQQFVRAIDQALEIADKTQDNLESLANQFSLDAVLQEQAVGYTLLWQPTRALEVYAQAERFRAFRPLREAGSFTIDKARALLHLGDFDQGIPLTQKGIELASEYRSKRHIARLESTYHRLRTSVHGKAKGLRDLRELLHTCDSTGW